MRVYTGSLELYQQAMIDYELLFNLISQRIIKQYNIADEDHNIFQAKNLNKEGICFF